MTQYLPGNLLALFTARPAIPFKPPVDRLKKRKNSVPYSPVTSFMTQFEVRFFFSIISYYVNQMIMNMFKLLKSICYKI